MTPLDMLSRRVATHAPTAPTFLIASHLRESAVAFLKRTKAWRHQLVITVSAPESQILTRIMPADTLPLIFGAYPAEPATAAARVHEIEAAWWNDRDCPLRVRSFAEFSPRERLHDGPPASMFYDGGNRIALSPRSAGVLHVSAFLVPSEERQLVSTHFVPQDIAERFGAEIVYGALGTLLTMSEKPWSNPELGIMYAAKDEREKDRNFDAHTKGIARTPTRSRIRTLL